MARARGGERDPSAVADVLASGEGLERFERMLRAQGGNGEALPAAPDVAELRAPASGTLAFDDVREVGLAVRALGGGRAAVDGKRAGAGVFGAVSAAGRAGATRALYAGLSRCPFRARIAWVQSSPKAIV